MQGRSKRQEHDVTWPLDDPRTRKWMVKCAGCGLVGYHAAAPARFFGRAHLVRHFKPIALDDLGLCEACHAAAERQRRSSREPKLIREGHCHEVKEHRRVIPAGADRARDAQIVASTARSGADSSEPKGWARPRQRTGHGRVVARARTKALRLRRAPLTLPQTIKVLH